MYFTQKEIDVFYVYLLFTKEKEVFMKYTDHSWTLSVSIA